MCIAGCGNVYCFIALVMIIHGVYFSIIEAGQVFAYKRKQCEIRESEDKITKRFIVLWRG